VSGSSELGGDFFEAMHQVLARICVLLVSDSEVWLACLFLGWVGRVALMESLILAQDERWRRA
jgi:hypothetical protein